MSRSRKKAIIKDSPRNHKKSSGYWRRVRRVINQKVRELINCPTKTEEIPDPKAIVNDYDYCDYIIDHEYDFKENNSKYKRK